MSLDDVCPLPQGAPAHVRRPRFGEALGARLLARLLKRLEHGSLSVVLPSGRVVHSSAGNATPEIQVAIHRWRALARLISGGDIGFAEGYMAGDWSTPNLAGLLELLCRNESNLETAWRGFSVARWSFKLRHGARANTPRGSRRNVEAHYDLGNAFYSSWLDRGMNYSSALYEPSGLTLEEAQIVKLERAIGLLAVKPGDHVLEIGCGWGALAERLATQHACRVTGITLSREQRAYACERMRLAGVSDRAAIRLQDYRDVEGQFDAVVSVEMLEAAGEAYWPVFFRKLRQRLAPRGNAVLQVITIDEARFETYRRRPDFIQRHIFPGGMLPTQAAIREHVAAAGLVLRSCQLFGESYARTLSVWRSRYLQSAPTLGARRLHTDRFRRMWTYYLAYCEAGFRAGALQVGLYQIARADRV